MEKNMDNTNAFSFIKGYTFRFEEAGDIIEMWCSALTGHEKLYVNGTLVLSKKSFSRTSNNNFSIGTNEYSITLHTDNLFKGPFTCTLSKNGQPYKRQNLVFRKRLSATKRLLSFFKLCLFGVFSGLLFSFLRYFFELPKEESFYIFMLIFLVSTFIYKFNINPNIEMTI